MNSMVFETPRLLVRHLRPDDLSAFHEMQGNTNVMRYTTGRGMTPEENERELNRLIDRYTQPDNDFWVWAVEEKTAGAFIGTCALVVNHQQEQEIGFRFLEKYWGQGFGTEIARHLIDYAFSLPDVAEIVAYVHVDNLGSAKVLERSPLQFERTFFNTEENCMDRVYRLARADYHA
ncbi:MAG: N-acetyltransferase [Bacteroidetes bacterium]|nr:MAG: N-acetyltransferase [Bacteroidota bacterium]